MSDLKNLGKRIQHFREKVGISQKEVAEYLSLDQSMISKMENGERKITLDVVEKLSSLFCCSSDYLLFGKEDESNCCISFRTLSLNPDDLKSLSIINKIVLNQLEIDKMLGD